MTDGNNLKTRVRKQRNLKNEKENTIGCIKTMSTPASFPPITVKWTINQHIKHISFNLPRNPAAIIISSSLTMYKKS